MTEKEKLKEIIETVLGFHDYYKVVVTENDIDRLVDKLIENGYGDVEKWKVLANDLSHTIKVAERALRKKCEIFSSSDCPNGYNSDKCKECLRNGYSEDATQCYFELAIQQAEREIAEEERK